MGIDLSGPGTQPPKEVHEKPLVEQINEIRAKANKPPLVEDPKLDQGAQAKVNDQVTRNYWAHHLPNEDTRQFLGALYPGRLTAENIAKCQTNDSQRVKDWVASPPHYAAMIGDYNEFGWAEKVNPADNNCVYTVTYFMKE
jgi:uncharacterized protein YkwD